MKHHVTYIRFYVRISHWQNYEVGKILRLTFNDRKAHNRNLLVKKGTRGTVVVVRENSVVVDEETGQQGTPRRAAHRCRYERVGEESAAVLEDGARLGHVLERTQFNILRRIRIFRCNSS